jgi:hypothetical protein
MKEVKENNKFKGSKLSFLNWIVIQRLF